MAEQRNFHNVNEFPETRSGVKTTEFWISLFPVVIGSIDLAGLAELLPDRFAGLLVVLAPAFYAIARGLAKTNVPNVPYRPDPQSSPAVQPAVAEGTTLVSPD